MVLFTIVRHGQTEWNAQKKWQGVLDSPLTLQGIDEMKKAAQSLKFKIFDQIHISPLGRARQSLDVILKEVPHLKNLPVTVFDELKERNVGYLQGIPTDEIKARFPAELKVRLDNPLTWHPAGGESSQEFIKRVRRYAQNQLDLSANKEIIRVLIVAHGGICAQLHTWFLGFEDAKAWDWKILNGSISTYLGYPQGWSCLESDVVAADETMDWIAT